MKDIEPEIQKLQVPGKISNRKSKSKQNVVKTAPRTQKILQAVTKNGQITATGKAVTGDP